MKKLAASLLVFACATAEGEPDPGLGGTDTGNPHNGTPGEETNSDRCDQVVRDLEPDEPTSIGVSAAELSWVGGARTESLLWLEQGGSFGPEHGRSELVIEIEPLGARFIDRSPARRASGGDEPAIEIDYASDPCADSIALDVRLHLSTSGGALNEAIDTTLDARAADYATGSVSLPLDMLQGSFEATVQAPRNSVLRGTPKLIIDMSLSPYGNTGSFGLLSEFTSTDGQAVGQGGLGRLARFPADDYCESGGISVAASQNVRGVSVDEVLERLNGGSPARLEGSTATLELSYQSAAQRVCVSLDGPVSGTTHVEFPGRVTLRSSDQRIDGAIDVTLSGEADAGVLQSSRAGASAFLLDRAQANAARTAYAIQQPLDFSSYDGGAFEFSAEVTDTEAVGGLAAYGLDQADCVTNPQPVDPASNSSPGCRGTDRIPLWTARWAK